ncbi:haloalkane dehalogenase [Desmospora sp. 8437]|nr:haloalkane dehalogenase [Desmospora sp. 8437]
MKIADIPSQGIRIRATRHSDKGVPLIFLHYFGGSSVIWHSIQE